ncbi:MAG TPA: signal peptidase I [Solirubrobacteraceae bacterium]|nr:signal peptidase I [Solirubrobacteraceae bacterium]
MSPRTSTGGGGGTGAASTPPAKTAPNRVTNTLLGLKGRRGKSKSTLGALFELVIIIVIALGLALGIQHWLVKPYRIPSGSMEPTLAIGQRVLVNRIGMSLNGPHVGEIAVFHPPRDAEQQICGPVPHTVRLGGAACSEPEPESSSVNFIKRIVAGPGDVISIVEGHVIRNGVHESDSYIKPCLAQQAQCNFPTPIKIPPGHWFMMGDNRGESDDSRFWGPVPTGWIIGGAFATYWPIDRIGLL